MSVVKHPVSKAIFILLITVAVLTVGAILLTSLGYGIKKANTISFLTEGQTVEYDKAVEYWQNRIRQSDTGTVGEEFVEMGNSLAVGQAHVLAHAFGKAVYEVYGVSGMSKCPDDFSYGCVHQFLGTALSQLGVESLKSIHTACSDAVGKGNTGCAHAMGHGIVGYFGYSPSNLDEGMRACDALEPAGPYSKCLSGAFMEFNFRELGLSVSSFVTPRPISSENVYVPCDALPTHYSEACFRQLPLWWSTVMKQETMEARYTLYGEFCRKAGEIRADLAEACFMGTGFAAAIDADLDYSTANDFCTFASNTEHEHALCISDVAYKLRISGAQHAADVCGLYDLTTEDEEYCRWRLQL